MRYHEEGICDPPCLADQECQLWLMFPPSDVEGTLGIKPVDILLAPLGKLLLAC